MVTGRAGTITHDYKRNGTATLFAALDVLTGVVIGKRRPATVTPSASLSSIPSTANSPRGYRFI